MATRTTFSAQQRQALPRYKLAYEMHHRDGVRIFQIAKLMGVSDTVVRALLRKYQWYMKHHAERLDAFEAESRRPHAG